jgi:hypothetical protein
MMTSFDFEPRFDSSSMIFGNLCSRRDTRESFLQRSWKIAGLDYETWQAASLGVEPEHGNPARARQRADLGRTFCQSSEARAVGEILAVNPNGRLPPPRKG